MKKVLLCLGVYVMLPFCVSNVSAVENNSSNSEARMASYISAVYQSIDFGSCGKLAFDVFDKAYRGFMNLKDAGKLSDDRNIISICDFSLSSTVSRLWIIDLDKRKVLFNTYVAHGQGSGNEFAESFSNRENSHKSSLGFYVTGDTYQGEHGTSLRLQGMDQGFNDAAFERGIVVHGSDYVNARVVNERGKLGRSWGCPAVPAKLSLPIINAIKNGTCLFIYSPEKNYLAHGYWLNKKISYMPEDMLTTAVVKPSQKVMTIQYMSDGKTDSVRTVPVSVH